MIPARQCPPARSAPIHAQLDSFITRQVDVIAMHSRKESPFASRPPRLCPGGSSGCDSWRRRQPRITASACRCSAKMLQPSSKPVAPSVGKMVCARRREAGGNLSYPSVCSRAMYSLTISLAIEIMHYPCFHYYIVITHYYHYYPLLHVTNGATCKYRRFRAYIAGSVLKVALLFESL